MKEVILTIVFLLFTLQAYTQSRISKEKLLLDFDYAVRELKLQHQGYANYTSETDVEIAIQKLRDLIDEPKTKLEFYQLIRKLTALMNEGHGSVSLPKWNLAKIGLTKSFLPLAVKFLDGQLIIAQNYGEDVSGLAKGMRIVSINDESIAEIYQNLSPLIATDGFNENSKYEWMGGANFSLLYRLVYGKKKAYKLLVERYDEKETKEVWIKPIRFTSFKSKKAKYQNFSFEYTKFAFRPINDSIAYLSIPDFGLGKIDYENFYKSSFEKIDSLGIKHLIIDIQANTGGEEGNENLLYSYLSGNRLRKYRKVTMLPIPFYKRENYRSTKFDKWTFKDTLAERGEFTLYSDYYSELGYLPPKPANIYEQKVYVLTSGLTFSGGAEFASMIKMSERGVFIGEETGGAYEGNVSSFNETIKLPNSKIKIDIPIVHFQIDVRPSVKGRGIMPGFHVQQTWSDYLNVRNAKLEFALALIMKQH